MAGWADESMHFVKPEKSCLWLNNTRKN
jgi:hypothetical protein